jgi:catechol 2,3-dioxygenase-like lactoylglutathione lyase family enzyme
MISLGVSDLERSIEFYETGLGFVRAPFDSETIAFFDMGGTQLALYPRGLLAEDAGVSSAGTGFAGFTLAQNLDSSAEVDAALARAVEAGGTLVKPGQPVFWGGYSGYFADPDGHLWEIACGSEPYAKEQAAT